MAETSYDLRPLWGQLLLIYKAIADIAKRHRLRFFANGGTILGALRHKGFIPWDDDFDLYMPRPDYEQFVRIVQEELPQGLKWHSLETDEGYPYLFGKVSIDDEDVVQKLQGATRLNLTQGVFVDVFPLDGMPNTRFGMLLFCIWRGILRRALEGKWWGRVVGMGFNAHQNRLRIQKWYSSWKYDECMRVGAVSPYDNARTLSRWWFKKKWFESAKEVPFENTKVPIPSGAHELMTSVFGNYMVPPPVEMRRPIHQK